MNSEHFLVDLADWCVQSTTGNIMFFFLPCLFNIYIRKIVLNQEKTRNFILDFSWQFCYIMASLAWNCFDISVQNVINIGKNHAKYFERTYVIQSTFFIHKFCVQPQEKSLSVSIKVRMLLHFYYVKTFDLHCIIYCVVNTTSICQHSVFLRQTIYKCSWAFRLKTCRFRGWVFIWISTCIGIHVQDFDVVKKMGWPFTWAHPEYQRLIYIELIPWADII